MNISITGNLGSGKSSVCRILKEKGFDIISTGSIFRELAVEHGMSVEAFNQKVNADIKKGDHSVDDMIDQRTIRINQERDNIVFDSRLAWNFAPDSFKVFVIVDISEAARRVYHDSLRCDSETYESVEACRAGLIHRQELEKQRFKELYGIDYYKMSNYNLVIESTGAAPEQVAEEIIKKFQEYQQGKFKSCMELNPSSIFPTRCKTELTEESFSFTQVQADNENPIGEKRNQEPVKVSMAGGAWFVKKGHTSLLTATKNKNAFIIAEVDNSFVPVVLEEDDYHHFESLGSFTYRSYPVEAILREKNLLTFE